MTVTIDETTEFGRRVAARLADERILWITTVDPAGTPQPTPIWFLWTGTDVLVASQPRRAKIRNIRANPRVALSLNAEAHGNDVVVLTGDAAVDGGGFSPEERAAYDAKYDAGIRGLGTTAEAFHTDYAVVIRIVPDRLRGW